MSQLVGEGRGYIGAGSIGSYPDRRGVMEVISRSCWSGPPSRGHDDLLISTALTARLDALDWRDRMARGLAAL